KSLDSRVFSDDWLWRLWCWCLMQACWKTSWKSGREIQPGQFATGRSSAAEQLRVSPSKLYRGLQTLAEWGQIRLEANSQFTVVTVCNWALYQGEEVTEWTAGEQQMDSAWTADEQPVDSLLLREEGKEGKDTAPAPPLRPRKKARVAVQDGFDDFWAAYPRKTAKQEAVKAWNQLTPSLELRATILAALERQKRCDQWTRDGGK